MKHERFVNALQKIGAEIKREADGSFTAMKGKNRITWFVNEYRVVRNLYTPHPKHDEGYIGVYHKTGKAALIALEKEE